MSNLFNQYNIMALSLVSNKIWDLITIILGALWSAFLWENATYNTASTQNQEMFRILKKISESYYFCSETRYKSDTYIIPCGYIIGPNYIAYIATNANKLDSNMQNEEKKTIHFILKIYGWFSIKTLITPDVISLKKGKYSTVSTLSLHVVKENYPESHFHKNTYVAAKAIFESIQETYSNSGVYLLHGEPGTGKTTTAKKVFDLCSNESIICKDISMTTYGNTFEDNILKLYNKHTPENDKYLICIFDEIDEYIDLIFNTSERRPYYRGMVEYPNKKSWNAFLEKVHSLQNVILILTTNKSKTYFDSLDPSLLRQYRLTKSFKFTHSGVEEDTFDLPLVETIRPVMSTIAALSEEKPLLDEELDEVLYKVEVLYKIEGTKPLEETTNKEECEEEKTI